jgi:uncharacterized protein YndB with AHSA1/START domain
MSSATGSPKARETTVDLPSDTETVVRRVFDGPARHVFDAWTTPEFVRQWYGYAGSSMTVCEIDLRPGGVWRWAQEMPDGMEIAFSGVYREVERPHRLAFSEVFEMMPGTDFEVTMTFEEHGDETLLTTHMRYQSQENRDGHLQSGMEEGTRHVYEQLDTVLAGMR